MNQLLPEAFSLIGMYGAREVFERRQREGYTEVAFGRGEWVDMNRIVAIWVFYRRPSFWRNPIATHEFPKFELLDGGTMRGDPVERTYSQKRFDRHLSKYQITLGPRQKLSETLEQWAKPTS